MESSLESLQDRLGYRFETPTLLTQALTHRSHGRVHNERLEFLGDSVLNCAVAAMLYNRFGRYDEGDLSRLRSNLVKQQSLYEIAQALALGDVLVLGEGERRSGGLKRPSILADTVEAIVGAVFLDGGFGPAQSVIGRLYEPILKSVDPKTLGKDAKTLLQEYLQGKRIPLPVYEVVATHGAAHSQVFEVECTIPKLGVRVSGSGGSRRAAEQSAAKLALEEAVKRQPVPVRKPRVSAVDAATKDGAGREGVVKQGTGKEGTGKESPSGEAPAREVSSTEALVAIQAASKEALVANEAASKETLVASEAASKETLVASEAASKETDSNDTASRAKDSKDAAPKGVAPRPAPAKDSMSKDPAARDSASKEAGAKDAERRTQRNQGCRTRTGSKDAGTRDPGTKDVGTRDPGAKDAGAKDAGTRDAGTREAAIEADSKGAVSRAPDAKESAVKEAADGALEALTLDRLIAPGASAAREARPQEASSSPRSAPGIAGTEGDGDGGVVTRAGRA